VARTSARDVAIEQDQAAEPELALERAHPFRQREPVEAEDEVLADAEGHSFANGTTSARGVSISPSGSMKRQNTSPNGRPSVSIQFGRPGSRWARIIRKLPSRSSTVCARLRETCRFAKS